MKSLEELATAKPLLKTLKNLTPHKKVGVLGPLYHYKELRENAIEWINACHIKFLTKLRGATGGELGQTICCSMNPCGRCASFMAFFNLTEEDLK